MKNNKKLFIYYGLIFILVVLIGISSFFFTYFYNLRSTDIKLKEIKIVENSNMSFSVKEKGTDVYNHHDDTYALYSIDNVNTFFNYTLTSSDDVYGEYSYSIVGYEIIGSDEKIKREVYKSDLIKNEITGKVISLNSNFDINIPLIIDDLNTYKQQNNINEEVKIRYIVTINYNLFSDKINKSIFEKRNIYIDIPINDITKIIKSEDINIEKYEISSHQVKDDELYLAIAFEFMGAIVMFILIILLLIRDINRESDIYQTTIDRIFKKYSNSIVNIKDLPDLSQMEVLFVEDFEDLIDASALLNEVINYNEVIVNRVSVFIVFNKKRAYCYKISK